MAPAGVWMRLLAVAMAVVVVMAAPPPSSAHPQVAMFCGKLNMHLDLRTGVWEPDPSGTTSCLSSSHDILKYCQQVYPDLRVTGVEEATQAVSVDNWCRRGKARCHANSHIVLPYHCLVEVEQEVDMEEATVTDGDAHSQLGDCVQMGQMKLDECHPARFWKRLARQMCLEYTLWDYTPRRPCGADGFRGIRYTCCPSPAGGSEETRSREVSSYDDYDDDDVDDVQEEVVAAEEEDEEVPEVEEEVVPEEEEEEEDEDVVEDEEEVDAPEEEFSQDEVEDEVEEEEQEEQQEEEEEGYDLRNDEDEAADKPQRSPYEDDLELWFDMNDAQSSEEADTDAAAPVGEDHADEDYPAVVEGDGDDDDEGEEEEEESDYETREGSDPGTDDYNVEYDWPSAPGHSDYEDREAEEEEAEEEAGETGADDDNDEQQQQQDVLKLYFDSPAGDELEHDRFLKAKDQLEVHHHLRLIQIMKAWEEAKINAENRPNSDRQAAALIKRFQRLVNQLDTALASAKQRLSDTHQSRVEAALNMQRRSALEEYLSQLQAQPPKRERLLHALKRYMWTEQRDQVHSVRHFQHTQRSSDPPPPPTALLMVQAHLTVIKKRLNESLSLLSQVPRLGPGIQAQISGLAAYVQSYGQGLLNVGQSYGSDGLMPPSDTPPALWPERAREGPPVDDDENGNATDEDLASDLFQMDARKAEQFNVWAVIALLVGIAVVTTVVIGSLVLLRRKAYRPVSTTEVDEELSHEERHLTKMQQNGYENPTYKLYEALQH
uniref:Amyloid-beta A4 protein-like n=1 Tax=Petromyzon marinus TaxID=7757 RepID=A0AAJ7UAS7_PETMA|nr:amyloid-beta A4 protein-like [Petromyzon marinus]